MIKGISRSVHHSESTLLGLVEGAEAAATNFDLHRFAVADEGLLMDIGLESGLGVTVGVADVVAAHTGL